MRRVGIASAVLVTLGGAVTASVWPDDPAVTAVPDSPASAAVPDDTSRQLDRISRADARPELGELPPSPSASKTSTPTAKQRSADQQQKKDRAPKKQKAESDTGSDDRAEKRSAPAESAQRKPQPKPERPAKVIGSRYTSTGLNVRTEPALSGDVVTVLASGTELAITGETEDGFRQVRYQDRARWVSDEYLSRSKPEPEPKRSPSPERKSGGDDAGPQVVDTRWTSTELNVRTEPSLTADVITVLDTGTKVSLTASTRDGFREIVHQGRTRWVSADYLAQSKPTIESGSSGGSSSSGSSSGSNSGGSSSGGISTAACSSGSSVESGLTPDAIRVHRAICARFPQVSSFGGVRSGSDYHGTGQAVDAMISDQATGQQIANWVRANSSALGVSEVIFAQKIWTTQRSSEGWRGMEDRGSVTANHYDHVHVSVHGNSGTV